MILRMNKVLSCLLFVFMSLVTQAQDPCSDIIYLPDGESMIFKCCVDRVEQGNLVYYTREGIADTVRALAIIVDGQRLDLSPAEDLEKQKIIPSVVITAITSGNTSVPGTRRI